MSVDTERPTGRPDIEGLISRLNWWEVTYRDEHLHPLPEGLIITLRQAQIFLAEERDRWDEAHSRPSLEALLILLHGGGYWITAWYPLSTGRFECRITNRSGGHGSWATADDPLTALTQAMTKARLL